jgi:hypothetical protein
MNVRALRIPIVVTVVSGLEAMSVTRIPIVVTVVEG